VVFPEPEGPRIAVIVPDLIDVVIPFIIGSGNCFYLFLFTHIIRFSIHNPKPSN